MRILLILHLVFVLLFPYVQIRLFGAPIYGLMPVLVIMVLLMMRRSEGVWPAVGFLRVWFILYFVAFLVGFVVQVNLVGTKGFLYGSYVTGRRMLALMTLPTLVVLIGRRPELFDKFRTYWAVIAALVGIWCILQIAGREMGIDFTGGFDRWYYYTLSDVKEAREMHGVAEYAVRRAQAGMWNPNVSGPALVISLPIALGLPTRRRRWLAYVTSGLIFGGIIASGSRQAMLGIVVCLGVLLLPGLRRRWRAFRMGLGEHPARVMVIIVVLLGGVYLAYGIGRAQIGRLEEGVLAGLAARMRGYREFFAYLGDNPVRFFLGQGADARGVAWRSGFPALIRGFVSNSWLLVIVEFGILGLVAKMGMFISGWRRASSKWALASLAGLAWIMLCDNAIHGTHFTQALFAMCIATAVLTRYTDSLVEAQWEEEWGPYEEQEEAFPGADGYEHPGGFVT